jgi:25S rRNA (uracil2634-N3)-methyltransferase
VRGFFQNAKQMLSGRGHIHLTHKTTYPYSEWNIKYLAESVGLFFIDEVEFQQSFYAGYYNKRGDGSKCDRSFPIGWSSTFKFSCSEEYSLCNTLYFQIFL